MQIFSVLTACWVQDYSLENATAERRTVEESMKMTIYETTIGFFRWRTNANRLNQQKSWSAIVDHSSMSIEHQAARVHNSPMSIKPQLASIELSLKTIKKWSTRIFACWFFLVYLSCPVRLCFVQDSRAVGCFVANKVRFTYELRTVRTRSRDILVTCGVKWSRNLSPI